MINVSSLHRVRTKGLSFCSRNDSLSGMLSGFLPHETDVGHTRRHHEPVDTLAEILGSEGYRTAAVISNYVLNGTTHTQLHC